MTADASRSRAPSDSDLGVALAGFLFLVVTTIVHLNDRGLILGPDGLELVQPDLWPARGLLFALQLLGAVAVLGLYRGRRWGWIGVGTVLGLWGGVAALLDRPLTTLLAIGFALYLLARAGTVAEASRA